MIEDEITNLEGLLEAIEERDERFIDAYGELSTNMPTFGGADPGDTWGGVWSWDDSSLLVGDCVDDLSIVAR